MSPHRALIRVLTIFLALVGPAVAVADVTPRQLVGGQLLRAAVTLVETQPVTAEALATATALVDEASTLNPDDVELCRLLFRVADVAENDAIRRKALGRLVKMDPDDDVARLLFVTDAVDQYQTVEGRLAVYEKLLAEPMRNALGATVASRLANDYAWLLDRAGDVDGFARWMAEAVALDPANRAAAATAAGFFRMNAGEDPFAEAELLTTLLLADPTSVDTQTMLASLLLANGAYVGADRLYDLAARSSVAQRARPSGGLLADRVVAQWGRGDTGGALSTVQRRQREADEHHRMTLRRDNPDLTPLELAQQHAPITSTLATVRAAILNRLGDAMAEAALEAALIAYDIQIGVLRDEPDIPPSQIGELTLEAAFVTLWLGGGVERAQAFLDDAATILGEEALSDDARTRFEGWIAFRRDDIGRAVELLDPIAERDVAAQLGVALCHLAEGRRRDAARGLYGVYTQRRGTLLGMWARDTLQELLGQPVPRTEIATKLETLLASVPNIVDRLPEEPTLALSVRLQPAKTTFGPYEPVIVNLEIANHAPFPLAIDPGGPVRPQVALSINVQIARAPEIAELRPMIVDIDRRLRLEPHERIVIPVDLRRGTLAQVLNRTPLRGASIKVTATIGFYVAGPESIQPGNLGSDVDSPPFRVDGVRMTPEWISGSIADVLHPDSVEDLETFALLSQLLFMVTRAREEVPLQAVERFGDPRRVAEETAAAIISAYGRLDPISRAWVLGAMIRSPILEPVYTTAQKDDHKLVRVAYLLYCLTGPDDPMIDAARRGDDPVVRRVADAMHARIAGAGAPQ